MCKGYKMIETVVLPSSTVVTVSVHTDVHHSSISVFHVFKQLQK